MALRIIKQLLLSGFITMIVAVPSSHAVSYPWPIATSITVKLTSSTSATYYLGMTTVQIDNPDITATTTVSEAGDILGIDCSSNTCAWGYYHRHNRAGYPDPTSSLIALLRFDVNDNFVDKATAISNIWGSGTITVEHWGSPNGGECAGTALSSWVGASQTWSWDRFLTLITNGGAGMGSGSCLGTPPANEWCALTQPSITLNFGSAVLTEASSVQASTSTNVECTTGMKYTLRLRGQDAIPLANGMSASLTADSRALGSTLNGARGLNTVSLGATLTGVPKAGSLSGNGVLFVSYP